MPFDGIQPFVFDPSKPLYPQFMPEMERIVRSFIDTDWYKITMGQFIWRYHRGVKVKWQLIVRTKDANLPKYILKQRLEQELDHARTVKLQQAERDYLASRRLSNGEQALKDDYLDFLQNEIELPEYKLTYIGNNILLTFEGDWEHNTWWEIFGLEIVNELYFRGQLSQMSAAERERFFEDAMARHERKLELLMQHPEVVLVDFGTRRRLCGRWQFYIDQTMATVLGPQQFRGTSNVLNAMQLGIDPAGTNAHELVMAISGIMIALFGKDSKPLHAAQRMVLDQWFEMYGVDLSVALPDTWTTELFFQVFTKLDAERYRSLRQDSGEPIAEGERFIQEWEKRGVDPKTKVITFSDGLEVEDAIRIAAHFKGRVIVVFGIGTSLTNDTLLKALSIVIKVIEAMGIKVVKLSQNPTKALGEPEDVEWTKHEVGYVPTEHVAVECHS